MRGGSAAASIRVEFGYGWVNETQAVAPSALRKAKAGFRFREIKNAHIRASIASCQDKNLTACATGRNRPIADVGVWSNLLFERKTLDYLFARQQGIYLLMR